jgi:hypothetical protein
MQEFLILIYSMVFSFTAYAVSYSKLVKQNFLNFLKELPFLKLILLLVKLAVHNFASFFLALLLVFYSLLLKTSEIKTSGNIFVFLVFVTLTTWSNKIEDYELFFSLLLFFSIFKILTLNAENRLILITNYYFTAVLPEPSITLNVMY